MSSFGFSLLYVIFQLRHSAGTQYPCSHPSPRHNLILHHYTKKQIILKRNEQQTEHGDCLLIPNL